MATNSAPQTQITTSEIDPATTVPVPPPGPTVIAIEPGPPAPAPAPAAAAGQARVAHQTKAEDVDPSLDNEQVVWEARYAMRNFLMRLIGLGILSLAWVGMAIYVWGYRAPSDGGLTIFTIVLGAVVGLLWLALTRRIILARYGHYYRLTNRRLFVSTGLFNRRRDQMELLRVQDVYTKQTLSQRLLSLGTVVVVSKEPHFPIIYLTGVEDPKVVMDVIWKQARAERDNRSIHVDQN